MHPEISRNRRLLLGRLRKRKMRQRERLYVAEGVRCAETVLEAGHTVRFALCTDALRSSEAGARVLDRLAQIDAEVVPVNDPELLEVSGTESPQGVLLVMVEPEVDPTALLAADGRLLLLDGVQDPGNVGTLVRTAAAFGLTGVIALDGTADP